MQYKVSTPDEYMESIPVERRAPLQKLREVINANLPKGFEECISYGMIGWVVPHSMYPSGYHCDPKLPLPFLSIASQKNFIGLYHMGMYADPSLSEWFQKEYAHVVPTKLDMGKSCVRLKKPETIPFELIGELCSKMTPADWIDLYEANYKR